MEMIVNIFFSKSIYKDELMILCKKDDIEPIILIHYNQNNCCLSCPEDLKTRLDNIEINYYNLWDNTENIVNALEVDGWKCK